MAGGRTEGRVGRRRAKGGRGEAWRAEGMEKEHAMGESRKVKLMEVIRPADVTSTGRMFFD